MPHVENVLLRKRFIIESTFDGLKNSMSVEHSRPGSVAHAFVNIPSALTLYSCKLNKSKIKTNFLHP